MRQWNSLCCLFTHSSWRHLKNKRPPGSGPTDLRSCVRDARCPYAQPGLASAPRASLRQHVLAEPENRASISPHSLRESLLFASCLMTLGFTASRTCPAAARAGGRWHQPGCLCWRCRSGRRAVRCKSPEMFRTPAFAPTPLFLFHFACPSPARSPAPAPFLLFALSSIQALGLFDFCFCFCYTHFKWRARLLFFWRLWRVRALRAHKNRVHSRSSVTPWSLRW